MTRRDFILISEVLKQTQARSPDDDHTINKWEEIVEAFARALRSTNPNFDADRFKAACGMGD